MRLFQRGFRSIEAEGRRPSRKPELGRSIEGLEPRLVLSAAALPSVVVDSAHTNDSHEVVIDYDITGTNLPPSLEFGLYRSADATYDSADSEIGSVTMDTASVGTTKLDDNGQPASQVGHHTLTIPLPAGLPPVPDQPYVLAVANPATAIGAPDLASRTGTIHTHVIGVVTHGGLQYQHDDATGPSWQVQMANSLRAQGYDSVIKYVWAADSRTPGRAARQGPKLARIINKVASEFPAGDPVDIHFIGHSEGTVVNSVADQLLQVKEAPQLASGFIEMTMLDPHAANSHAPGYQYSIANGTEGSLARKTINFYQWVADDPIPSIPPNVDEAQVFWQHTPVQAAWANSNLYNLWGQVPVRGNATYYDLTGPGISHTTVHLWYQENVVPTLGSGGNFADPTILTGHRVLGTGEIATRWQSTTNSPSPEFAGTSAPDASITLFAARRGSVGWERVGTGQADGSGQWTVSARPLPQGRFRFVVRASTQALIGHPHTRITPRLRLGAVDVLTRAASPHWRS